MHMVFARQTEPMLHILPSSQSFTRLPAGTSPHTTHKPSPASCREAAPCGTGSWPPGGARGTGCRGRTRARPGQAPGVNCQAEPPSFSTLKPTIEALSSGSPSRDGPTRVSSFLPQTEQFRDSLSRCLIWRACARPLELGRCCKGGESLVHWNTPHTRFSTRR